MKITTAAEFVKQKVQPEHRDIVDALRALMRECAPGSREVITYGILGWKATRILAVLSPTRNGITFAFSRGAEFDDKHGLLQGAGHVSKNVRIGDLKDINRAALRYYIRQAVKLDREDG